MLLQILINVKRNMVLQRNGTEIATFLPITAGKCSEILSDNCWALLKGYRKATG
jgi:hypothetical protein